jgi:molybdopterin-containing oxidoreductase family iron-sulfur binding subunit
MLVKNRDGHIIKVEGNPLHPVNTGRLCARGQASVQGIYNPDRYKQPLMRDKTGVLGPTTWPAVEREAIGRLSAARGKGDIIFMSHLMTGTEQDLADRWMKALGGNYVVYEPLAYEPLRKANQLVFGNDRIPNYHIEDADFLVSFGADFLETWLSNVQFSRQFTTFHEPGKTGKNFFAYVGPRLSMTGASADQWIPVPVGGTKYVALGLLRILLEQSRSAGLQAPPGLASTLGDYTPRLVEERTGVKPDVLSGLAHRFARARRPLVLAEGMSFSDPDALDTALAANVMCSLNFASHRLLDFSNPLSLDQVSPATRIKGIVDRMAAGGVAALVVYRANPAYTLPPSWGFEKALEKVPVTIGLSSFPDETTERMGLVMPSDTFLESWGDYSPQGKVTGLLQPAMGRLFDTRPLGDVLLTIGKGIAPGAFPEPDFYTVLRNSWEGKRKSSGANASAEAFWLDSVQHGGLWQQGKPAESDLRGRSVRFALAPPAKAPQPRAGFNFLAYPTIQFFDGSLSNRPFLQEMPDPVTMIAWDGWVEINPETAKEMGIEKGDLLALRSEGRTVEAPAFPYFGILPGNLAMPVGHGHTRAFGRYVAAGPTGNPRDLFPGALDQAGGLLRTLSNVTIEKTGRKVDIANADGSAYQHGRRLAQSLSYAEYRRTLGDRPDIVMPLPSGWSKETDFYPAHEHVAYRWGMVIDLDRCIGCQACVVACYAENNVGVVGKKNFFMGREMSWLHIERYFEPQQPYVRFLPMLCQHCDSAPCESVCPVFAPNHSKEGINNQVYNRCIGTRDCNQNCPWKVRRFNWYLWKHDHPLEWQLNPDVTVRQRGVMEKCSFCIQRIVHAKTKATSEGRKVRDGEFTTACAQTCPADAITFGSFMDPESRVSKLVKQARAYQVLGSVNTKTAVIYLKRIVSEPGV